MKLIFFILIGFGINAQNLVPNPSFEIYSQCPLNFADITSVDSWYRLPIHYGTPDYFNACNSSSLNVPNNFNGSQVAFDGNAYIGIITYSSNYSDFREYIQTQLTSPMIAGQTYLVSFYVSCADENRFSSNNIGAILTASSLSGNNWSSYTTLNITPQINYPTPITNITGWTLISGNYLASGNEQYLTIGNFYKDDLTQSVSINPFGANEGAYYYIDQVNVTQSHLGNSDYLQQKYLIEPNPVNNQFTIVSSQSEVITNLDLYSTYNKVKSYKPNDTYNMEDLSSGIYYLIITFESNRKSICKIIKL